MSWRKIRYFKPDEFDSPDLPRSGTQMNLDFVRTLDDIRHTCAFPFRITSGFRTVAHNRDVRGAVDSAHLYGFAADISAQTSRHRFAIVNAAIAHGVRRIGVHKRFVHLDMDPKKVDRMLWVYTTR